MATTIISTAQISERFEHIRYMESLAGYDDDNVSEDFKKIEEKYINFELTEQEFYILCIKSACKELKPTLG